MAISELSVEELVDQLIIFATDSNIKNHSSDYRQHFIKRIKNEILSRFAKVEKSNVWAKTEINALRSNLEEPPSS